MDNKFYYFNQNKVKILHNFMLNDNKWVVISNEDGYDVQATPFSNLISWEESYEYKKQKTNQEKFEKLKKDEARIVKRIQVKALKALEARLRFNVAFSKENEMTVAGLAIAQALDKIIQEYKLSDMEIKSL